VPGEPSTTDDERFFRDARSRSEFRTRMLQAIPRWYSPWAHLAATAGIGAVALAFSLSRVAALRPLELLIVPIAFVISNLGEWHAHRNLLHRRWRPVAVLYDRHTPEHHRVYRYGDMAIRSVRELRLVLIPAMGVLGIIVTSAPIALLLAWLLNPNVGWLFLATTSFYVTSYELSHLSYHLPEQSFIGRLKLVTVMREHHARHHDPRLMQRYNFNVTVPLGDWLFGTFAPTELVESAQDPPSTRRAAT
jgi:sterol desaturase/sphingolipid hydroxylase (fatty acid hydroxylase superfamily)